MTRFGLFLVLLLSLHGVKVLRLVPLESFTDHRPVVGYANCEAFTDIVRDRAFLAGGGDAWGYDPFVAAGEPAGLGRTPSSVAPVVFDRAARVFFRPETSHRLFIALALLLGPILLYAAARLFQIDRAGAVIAAVMLSAGMVGHDFFSKELIYRGQIPAWLGAIAGLFNVACLYHLSTLGGRRAAAGFAASTLVLPILSGQLAVALFVPWVAILLWASPDGRRPVLRWAVGSAIVSAAFFAFFIEVPRWLLAAREPADWTIRGFTVIRSLFLPLQGDWMDRLHATTRAYLLVFGISYLASSLRERLRFGRIMRVWGSFLFITGFFGWLVPVLGEANAAPFIFTFTSFLLIFAGGFLARTMLRPGTVRLIVFVWYLWFVFSWQIVHKFNPSPLRVDLTPREHQLLTDLRTLPPDGRILVQYGPLFTDGLRLAAVAGRQTFAGFAGAGWTTAERNYGSFVRAADGWDLLGYPLSSYSEEDLVARLQRFNISHVVTTAATGRDYFTGMASFERLSLRDTGSYAIFRLREPSGNGYLISGAGRVTPSFGDIRIIDASSGTIVTSFLWSPGFRASPPAVARPYSERGDSAQYLAVDNPAGGDVRVTHGR